MTQQQSYSINNFDSEKFKNITDSKTIVITEDAILKPEMFPTGCFEGSTGLTIHLTDEQITELGDRVTMTETGYTIDDATVLAQPIIHVDDEGYDKLYNNTVKYELTKNKNGNTCVLTNGFGNTYVNDYPLFREESIVKTDDGTEYTIVGIGDSVFENYTDLRIESLPKTIVSIGSKAFYNCSCLPLKELPSGITAINDYTFYGCSAMELSELPTGVTSIGSYSFYGCTNISLSEIPSGVTSLGTYAFGECKNITIASLPSTFTEIPEGLFYYAGNSSNTYVYSLKGITKIGVQSLSGFHVTISEWPEGLTTIEEKGCAGGSYGQSFPVFPSTLTYIGTHAFRWNTTMRKVDCTKLTSLTVGDNPFYRGGQTYGFSIVFNEDLYNDLVTKGVIDTNSYLGDMYATYE